jgi:hypothetical protein
MVQQVEKPSVWRVSFAFPNVFGFVQNCGFTTFINFTHGNMETASR